MTPQVIGGYTLLRVLGRGGMGEVHLAATPTGGLAAVKVIHPALARDPAFRRRFSREVSAARTVARFCTAPVLDAGLDGEVAYLVTEYVKGPDLSHAVREQGPLTGGNLEALAVGIATALSAIHGAGVIHRDLKPSNVLLSPLGPRVIDFGIAQLVGADSLVSQAIMGTPAFMAPEQVRGEQAGPSADVFAWGGVIAFAGTGRLPFGGGAPAEVLYRIVNEGPHLQGLDERARGVVEWAMAKDPAKRPTAQQLLAELVGGQPTPAAATMVVERTWTGPVTTPPAPAAVPGPVGGAQGAVVAAPGAEPPHRASETLHRGPEPPNRVSEPPNRVSEPPNRAPELPNRPPEPPNRAPEIFEGAGSTRVGPPSARGPVAVKRRRWLWAAGAAVLVVAVAVAGLVVFRPGAPAWPYHADFASWETGSTDGGTVERSGDHYVLTANPGWRLWRSAPLPTEPDTGAVISAKARRVTGTGEFGVWCRGVDAARRYEFAVTSAGQATITKRQAGKGALLDSGPAPEKSGDRRIVVECRSEGPKTVLRMWLDEELVGEATDTSDPLGPGPSGVFAAPDGDRRVSVRFGSFDVRAAQG
ncbi:serine/threonine-protein kinase [Nonomuraea sp. NPDC059194]|uniref:serine/threonine-protein kinase n=1 Tax=Nonomuraea sp. NPDC059194 TaxID=3346764 RepID=UPI0036C2BB21